MAYRPSCRLGSPRSYRGEAVDACADLLRVRPPRRQLRGLVLTGHCTARHTDSVWATSVQQQGDRGRRAGGSRSLCSAWTTLLGSLMGWHVGRGTQEGRISTVAVTPAGEDCSLNQGLVEGLGRDAKVSVTERDGDNPGRLTQRVFIPLSPLAPPAFPKVRQHER